MASTLKTRTQTGLNAVRRRVRLGKRWAGRAWLDFQDQRAGDRNPLLPPRRLNLPSQIGAAGERLTDLMEEAGGLGRSSDVLDIGCGPGRIAAVLTERLSPSGSYEGFDVMPESIAWCSKAITPRYPNFRFQLADIENAQYNPGGSQRASSYDFPYPDASFDVALAGSLFTHLRPFEAQRYLDETARTLRPGGRLVGTWFLLDDEIEAALAAGTVRRPGLGAHHPPLRLEHHLVDERGNGFRSFDPDVPEFMIAVPEAEVIAQHERAGFDVREIRHGGWRGSESGTGMGQDAIIAQRSRPGG